jgi:hypothetical protein
MPVVMVEFAVGTDKLDACVEALTGITGTVLNYMLWDTHQDFINFRDGNAKKIGEVLGEFGPQGRMLDVVAEIPKA